MTSNFGINKLSQKSFCGAKKVFELCNFGKWGWLGNFLRFIICALTLLTGVEKAFSLNEEAEKPLPPSEEMGVDLDPMSKEALILQELEPQHEEPYLDGYEEDRLKLLKTKALPRVENPANRIFELGVGFDLSANNNALTLDDLLKKTALLDLDEMHDRLDGKDFAFSFSFLPNFFMNLNLRNGIHVGLETGVESYGSLMLSNELFELLSKGNDVGKPISFDIDSTGDAFFFVNASVGVDFSGYHLEVKPAVYTNIFHIETQNSSVNFLNESSGKTTGSAHTDIAIYSCLNLENIFEDGMDMSGIMGDLKSGWGFDIETSLEHKICKGLIGSIYSRIPIVPSVTSYKMRRSIDLLMNMDPLTNGMYDDERGDETDFTMDFSEGENIYSSATHKQHRPFRMGTQVAYRPLSRWFTLGALLGFGVKNPFSSEQKAFVEYSLIANTDIFIKGKFNIFALHFSSSYLNEMFRHKAELLFNTRVLEIDIGIEACSTDFVQSFHGAGLGAFLKLSIGF